MRTLGLAARSGILILAFALGAFGQTPPSHDNWEAVCRDATAQPLTEPRLTGPLKEDELPKCDARSLYYGFGSAPDYPAALQCGWYQRGRPEVSGSSGQFMYYGVGVLSMLYANGRGVPRNYDFAIRFTCEQTWASTAETAYRLARFDALKNGKPADVPFDLCDDITSGLGMGACESVAQELTDVARVKKIKEITSTLSPAQKQAYDKVSAAEDKFEDVRVFNEIDMTGTARGMLVFADRGRLRDQFLINLERFEKGEIPQATAQEAKKLDEQMNAAYQRVMKAPAAAFKFTTVTAEGVRETQRAWLQLRDAWLAFAKLAYPALTADRVAAQLIRLRLHQLEGLPIDLKK